jgi:altronate dehydratase small subunit
MTKKNLKQEMGAVMTKFQAIVMNPNDNVGTVVEPIAGSVIVCVNISGQIKCIQAVEKIPLGHKLALCDIVVGDSIIKYGEIIGLATRSITAGQHVHIHNLESCRGRGDKQEAEHDKTLECVCDQDVASGRD